MIDFNKISKYLFCIFVFFAPFFFLPGSVVPQAVSQKLFLILFASFLFLVLSVRVFIERKIVFKGGIVQLLLFLFLLVASVSTIFSKNLQQSFWGGGQQADSLLFIIVGCLMFFLSANSLKRRDVVGVLESFIAGTSILSILFLVQRFIKVDMVIFENLQPIAIILSLAFIILIYFVFNSSNYFKRGQSFDWLKVGAAVIFLSLLSASLIIIDFKLAWFLVAIGVFISFWRAAIETDFNIKSRRSLLNFAVLLIALFFLLLPKGSEVDSSQARLSYGDSFNIVIGTLSESTKSFIFGSGPSTFSYQFSLYKGKDLNQLGMGSLIFDQGATPFFTVATTTGAFGLISFLLIVFLFYYYGFKNFISKKRKEKDFSINVSDILFAIALASSMLFFFYRIDVVGVVCLFLFLGLWFGQQQSDEKMIRIEKYSKNLLEVLFVAVLAILILVVCNFVNYYRSESLYEQALADYRAGAEIEQSIAKLEKASQLWKDSDNYITLSQLYILKASKDYSSSDNIQEAKGEVRETVIKAEGLASFVTEIDPFNFQSWQNLGLIYENADFLVDNETDKALDAYDKAEKLAPQNEDIYVAEGRMLEEKGEQSAALEKYEKAFMLNPLDQALEKKINMIKK